MPRFLAGAVAALALIIGGVFLWQSRAGAPAPLPDAPAPPEALDLPDADGEDMEGDAPPKPPEAAKATREEVRFNRYDRDRDGIVTRIEMMSTRTKAFKQLDKDGNNLLSFEEWAAATGDRFAGADANKDGRLDRAEFATTRPKRAARPKCAC